MGRFADAWITQLSEQELNDYERLMEVPDPEVFAWITDERVVPANYNTDLFRRLRAFRVAAGGAKD